MSAATPVSPLLLRDLPLPALPAESDKNARGRVLVVGGSIDVPGAALLTAVAAMRAGAGKVQITAIKAYAQGLALSVPETRVITVPASGAGEIAPGAAKGLGPFVGRSDAVIVGPGMLEEGPAADLAVRLGKFETEAGFLIDAAAFTGLRDHVGGLGALAGRLVFTPHAGEMAAFLQCERETVEADPVMAARSVAEQWGAVVVMKGVATHIVSPGGQVWLHDGGSPGLGCAGSGDVLAGVIGGLLARGAPPATAAIWGVYLHGAAGAQLAQSVGPLGFLAREIPPEIPRAMARIQIN